MDTLTALKTRRSIRRFTQEPIDPEKLEKIMECTRFYPSAANLQELKFVLLTDDRVRQCLEHLHWAGYLPGYRMTPQEQPTALVLILADRDIKARDFQFSAGAAANQLMLAAHALELASCCLGMSDRTREEILTLLALDRQRFELICAVALGNSEQTSQAVDMTDSIKYTLDEKENFLVPKRTAEDIFLKL